MTSTGRTWFTRKQNVDHRSFPFRVRFRSLSYLFFLSHTHIQHWSIEHVHGNRKTLPHNWRCAMLSFCRASRWSAVVSIVCFYQTFHTLLLTLQRKRSLQRLQRGTGFKQSVIAHKLEEIELVRSVVNMVNRCCLPLLRPSSQSSPSSQMSPCAGWALMSPTRRTPIPARSRPRSGPALNEIYDFIRFAGRSNSLDIPYQRESRPLTLLHVWALDSGNGQQQACRAANRRPCF